jgi:phage-related protein
MSEELTKGQKNLQMMNEMYKAAFRVKMQKIADENPNLSEKELLEMTAAYFRNLHGVNYGKSNRSS